MSTDIPFHQEDEPHAPADQGEFRPVHPGALTVWRMAAGIFSLVVALGAAVAEVSLAFGDVNLLLPPPVWSVLLYAALLAHGWWYAGARWRSWRYHVGEAEVVVVYGVLWRLRRSIPRARIQHVDVHSGPLDRLLGLAQLSLYTAGSMGPIATIPGLTPDDASALRDALVARDAP